MLLAVASLVQSAVDFVSCAISCLMCFTDKGMNSCMSGVYVTLMLSTGFSSRCSTRYLHFSKEAEETSWVRGEPSSRSLEQVELTQLNVLYFPVWDQKKL